MNIAAKSAVFAGLGMVLGVLAACTATSGYNSLTAGGDLRFVTDVEKADFHLLMAEFALEQEKFEEAAQEYRKAAQLSDDVNVASRAALIAYELGVEDEALASSRRWVTLAPDDTEARRYLIRGLIATGLQEETTLQSLKFLELLDDNPEGRHLDLLSMLIEAEDSELAVRVMRAVVSEYEDSSRAHYAMATLALQARDDDLALESASRAKRLDPDWVPAALVYSRALIASGDVDGGLNEARRLAQDTGEIAARLEYALLLLGADRGEDARGVLEAVLADQPRTALALKTLGIMDLRAGNLDSARSRFTELLATGRDAYDAFYYLAWIAEQKEDHPRALRLYARVNAGPNASPAHIRSSRILHNLGSSDAALQLLAEFALNNPPAASQMTAARGELLADMGRYDEAFAVYDTRLSTHPDDSAIRYAKAYLYERVDRVDDAVKTLRAILKDNSQDPVALNALGYTLTDRTDRHREAYRLIKKALELDPDNAAIIDSMGWVQYRMGNVAEAVEYLKRAYTLQQDPEIAAHLGEALYVLGEESEARLIWDQAAQSYPDNRHIEAVLERFSE